MRVKKDGQTATVKLTVRLKDVNQPVTIDVPDLRQAVRGARPADGQGNAGGQATGTAVPMASCA